MCVKTDCPIEGFLIEDISHDNTKIPFPKIDKALIKKAV